MIYISSLQKIRKVNKNIKEEHNLNILANILVYFLIPFFFLIHKYEYVG